MKLLILHLDGQSKALLLIYQFHNFFQDRRWVNYERFDEALVKLKSSKDVNAFKMSAKTLANDQKNESQAILDLSSNLKTISPEVAEKVNELQRLDG